jgi:SsrA-binding protein
MAQRQNASGTTIAVNRKARRDYFVEETFEAGIALTGTEVKSLRGGRASLNEAFAGEKGGEIFLFNAHIPEYAPAGRFNHDPRRPRKLLLHRREIARLMGAIQRKGATLVPLSMYFNGRGMAKVSVALAHGKRQHDKRAAERDRDWQRQKSRLLRKSA